MNDDPQTTERVKHALIAEAERGDAEAGRQILRSIALTIEQEQFDPILFPFLAKCLWLFIEGAPIAKALCVEDEPNEGGAPPTYDGLELAAVDMLLRECANLGKEKAIEWIENHIGADRLTVYRSRKKWPLERTLICDDLLENSGSLRRFIERDADVVKKLLPLIKKRASPEAQ